MIYLLEYGEKGDLVTDFKNKKTTFELIMDHSILMPIYFLLCMVIYFIILLEIIIGHYTARPILKG